MSSYHRLITGWRGHLTDFCVKCVVEGLRTNGHFSSILIFVVNDRGWVVVFPFGNAFGLNEIVFLIVVCEELYVLDGFLNHFDFDRLVR